MGLKAEILTRPGLFDLAEDHHPDVLYQTAVHSFLATPRVTGTEVESDLMDEISRSAETTEGGFAWFTSVRRWLLREKHSIVDETQMVELGAYWLTVPPVSGASGQIDVDSASAQNSAASFKLAGIGGGPEFTIKVYEGLSVTAATDKRIALSARGKIQTIAVTRGGERITTYPRLASLDKNHLKWEPNAALPPSPAAGVTPSQTTQYDASDGDPITATFEMAQGTSWEFGVDFKAETLGIEVKSTTRVSYESEVKFTHVLPGGGYYVAAHYPDIPARLWSLEAAKNY
ncbi:hypothetical protein [Streptomyces cupreus]|uniref:Uncharacterized protein n=1 Tax=Streptomyces cupreus TaxID=2759956 RepID=A0A7X1M8Y3_9ACTN|nr:hypothetical protein [Streptomyces cupreus]MBC2902196.1 hypothetical protein [Streptomyces cupreus]